MPIVLAPVWCCRYFSDDVGKENSEASSIAFVRLALLVPISVHSMFVVAVVMCSR